MICPNCGQKFDPADRAGPTTPVGSAVQIRYCSVKCKRSAGNHRYYLRRQKPIIDAMRQVDRLTDRGRHDPTE